MGGTVSEFDRVPHDQIKRNLELYGAPDRIFWYERPWIKKARQIYAGQFGRAFDLSVLPSNKLREWGLGYAPVTYTPHHASHAAAGYYTSPFNHAVVVVIDAIGEFECVTIWEAKHGELTKLWSKSYPHSLGLFYSAFTKLISLEPIKQEFVLEQMAALGDPNRYYTTVLEYMGPVVRAHKNMHRGINDWPHEIVNLQDQCDIAAAVQKVFNLQINAVMKRAVELTGANSLVYMGGCAMNKTANQLHVEPKFKYIWSLPNPGDPSSSLGAVLYHTKTRMTDINWGSIKHIEIRV